MHAQQLPLILPFEPSYAGEDVIIGPHNIQAVGFLNRWPDWPHPFAVLVGEAGSGKTHLAQIWAQQAGAVVISPDMSAAEVIAIAGHHPIVLDGYPYENEPEYFAILNAILTHKHGALITATQHPEFWPLTTKDIRSRLRAAPVLALLVPDEEALYALLHKLFSDRQIQVEPNVLHYIAARLPRSFAAVQNCVTLLDEAALIQKKPITRTLAASIVSQYFHDSDDENQFSLFENEDECPATFP